MKDTFTEFAIEFFLNYHGGYIFMCLTALLFCLIVGWSTFIYTMYIDRRERSLADKEFLDSELFKD